MYIYSVALSRADFTKFTRVSGANARSPNCVDDFGNCHELANECCFNRKVRGGMLLSKVCCASCAHTEDTGICSSSAVAAKEQCMDSNSNCGEIAKYEYQC